MIKIVMSFDDGRSDNYIYAYPLLKKHNLPATFHITTGYIDGTWIQKEWVSDDGPMSKEEVYTLYDSGFEISSHTDTHEYSLENIKRSVDKLNSWGIKNVKGLSIPNSSVSKDEIIKDDIIRKNKFKYVRLGRNHNSYSFHNKIIYLLYKLTKNRRLYYLFNRHNINSIGDEILYSVVVHRDDRVENIIYFLERLIKENIKGTIVLMFHSIFPESHKKYRSDKWTFSERKFEELLIYFKNNKDNFNIKKMHEL